MTTPQPKTGRQSALGWWHARLRNNQNRTALGAVLGVSVALCASGAHGQIITAGSDHYRTLEDSSWIQIGGGGPIPPIPADFFGPGSDPFEGQIALRGNPIPGFPGEVDTIVERTADADMTGGSATVEVELVELNLVSTEPIRVTDGSGIDSFFDVYVEVLPPPDPPSDGSMTITEENSEGGIYSLDAADGNGIRAQLVFYFVEAPSSSTGIASALPWIPPTSPHLLTTAFPGAYQYDEPPSTCDPGTGYYLVPDLPVMLDLDGGNAGALALVPCSRGWMPGDLHKMHWPQLPDEQGWDVNATSPNILADDWRCIESGPVKDIHFWGSWKDMDGDGIGDEGQIMYFNLVIHTDIPDPDPLDPTTFSMPGMPFWDSEIWDFGMIPVDPPTVEAWLDPPYDPLMSTPNDHDAYFQYDIILPDYLWFEQVEGTIYWLEVSAVLFDDINYQWGWKSTIDHFNDDAVWFDPTGMGWQPLVEPPRVNFFSAIMLSDGTFGGGTATNAYGEGWYEYPQYEWWNVWFYDNPFTYENFKSGWMQMFVVPMNDLLPSEITVAVNWSTDLWSLEGVPGRPPLPEDFIDNPELEDLFIGRQTLVGPLTIPPEGIDIYEYFDILYYNPEWISVDIQGTNFMIIEPYVHGGMISHECVQTSMDLAFVITPGELGACCYPDAVGGPAFQCVDAVTEGQCISQLGGVWQGDFSVCLGTEACCLQDGSCIDADALCCVNELDGTPQGTGTACQPEEACCLPDYTCQMADPLCCVNELHGVPQGPGSFCQNNTEACCLPDNSCVMANQFCCWTELGGVPQGFGSTCGGVMEACCLSDNSCVMADATCCVNELHGTPQGPFSTCGGALEACCLQDDTCVMADPICCMNILNGSPQGAGSLCTGLQACCDDDASGLFLDCLDLDPLCCVDNGGFPQGFGTACTAATVACCIQDGTGACFDVDPLCCDDMGGIASGWSAVCLGDGNGNQIDDACEAPPTGACCLDNGTCQDLPEADCNVIAGAAYKGNGTWCFGDMNGNGIDDACETPWQPGDAYKMHFPQLPDETGWDVMATAPIVLADDWQCSETGWVTDVHFWGSWKDDIVGEIDHFVLSFHEDIPADQSPTGHSMPGATLQEVLVPNFVATPIDPPTMEGWYDPSSGDILPDNHWSYFQYDVYLPPDASGGFWQNQGTIYWLNISAVLAPDATGAQWGWKSSVDHWNDDAVWAAWGSLQWAEMYEPFGPVYDDYWIVMNPGGIIEFGGGTGFNEGFWYEYPNYGWWNQWFYDHPYYENRWKEGWVDFFVYPFDPGFESFIELAVNYSTPAWSIEGNPPPDPRVPPLPPMSPAEEDMYIGRDILFSGLIPPMGLMYTFPFEMSQFNPEWVSIDVRGINFVIDPGMGIIAHDCMGSLDLAFVITGEAVEPEGACCWDDHTCTITTQGACEGVDPLGVWQGPGTVCGGIEACCMTDGTCTDADALCCMNVLSGVPAGPGTSCPGTVTGCCLSGGTCEDHEPVCCTNAWSGTPQASDCVGTLEACCFDDGSCLNLDPVCCDDEGGDPSPTGATVCAGDGNGDGHDDSCEPPLACCMPDGSCTDLSHTDCVLAGGDPQGPGTDCTTAVCSPLKWAQPPTFSPLNPVPECFWGWDEMSIYGLSQIVADDFLCEDSKPITDIHWWGSYQSYLDPEPPPWGPPMFRIHIWTDVPAGVDMPWSHPGMALWEWVVPREELNERPVGCDFYPGTMFAPDTCFRYDFDIPEAEWFLQESGANIYWISIAGYWPISDEGRGVPAWGWKTRQHFFNDDAVRVLVPTDPIIGSVFMEGFPIEDPPETSWDMAFVLTTKGADPPTIPGGEPGYDKIRYISFEPANAGKQTALRVTLTTMPPPYAGFSGQQMWVGDALEKCENGGVNSPPCPPVPLLPASYQSANLQCTPYCMDFGSVGALHVTDDEIIPNAVYDVQAIDCNADFGVEANYSDPLTIGTSVWADLVKDCTTIPCGPPDGSTGIVDVTAILDKFKNLPGAVMKSRADIDPNLPDWLVNITDVTFCLDAFLGFTYPPPGWTGPGGCR